MKRFLTAIFVALSLYSCAEKKVVESVNVIPMPAEMELTGGVFELPSADYAPEFVKDTTVLNPEGYRLTVNDKKAVIFASTDAGYFYGLQTFNQLKKENGVPCVEISDAPRFGYRGFMLDVARNFFPKEYVLKLIKELSYYKMNRLHLHLTDGGGWRVAIDGYPKLTSHAAFRSAESLQDWIKGDNKYVTEGSENAHGGYFTKEDIREIVDFAKQHNMTVVPEIEMPSHSSEVFAAYPDLNCTGREYGEHDLCIGNEASFKFVEGVLSEVIEMFPSEYIHIGGDEASKSSWEKCPKCQKRMRDNNLKNVDELQSYMIKRVEKFLNAHGRKLLGWDEILEGGLAPEATVMSWRGEAGGVEAAKSGHDVVMTPSKALYFDFYQADPPTQPTAIGGYIPIKTVYEYNPVPEELNQEEVKHILGAQANQWSEHISTTDHSEYMIFPRILAVAEMTWTPQQKRNWNSFKARVNTHIPQLRSRGINAFTLSDDIEFSMVVDTVAKEIKVYLDAEKHPAEVRYTTDGTTPDSLSAIYDGELTVKDSAHIVAAIFNKGVMAGKPSEKSIDYHKAINAPVEYLSKLYDGYMAGGKNALVDGYRGSKTYLDGRWQGYLNDLECIIDLGSVQALSKVSTRFMELKGPGVYFPGEVEVLISEDGKRFTSVGVVKTASTEGRGEPIFDEYTVYGKWNGRFVKVKASEVHSSFIFLDEIVVW